MRRQLLLLLLLLRGGVTVAMGRVKSRGRGQGVGIPRPLAQPQPQVVVGALLDKELLQAAVSGDPRQEVLVSSQHATELLVQAARIGLANQGLPQRGHSTAARGVRGRGGGGRRGGGGGTTRRGLRDREAGVKRGRRRGRRDHTSTATAPKVKAAHPRMQLLLCQRSLGGVKGP